MIKKTLLCILLIFILTSCEDSPENGIVVGKDGSNIIVYEGNSKNVKSYKYDLERYKNIEIKDTIKFNIINDVTSYNDIKDIIVIDEYNRRY